MDTEETPEIQTSIKEKTIDTGKEVYKVYGVFKDVEEAITYGLTTVLLIVIIFIIPELTGLVIFGLIIIWAYWYIERKTKKKFKQLIKEKIFASKEE